MDATVIRNPNYQIQAARDDFYLTAPEDGGMYPYLFVLGGGDYTLTDLTVAIVGSAPVSDWSIFGIRDWLGHGITSMAGPFAVVGGPTDRGYREANAAFYRVKLTGEHTDDPLFGVNIYNGIFIEGFAGSSLQSLKGTFSISNSVFETVGSAFPVLNLTNSRVTISGNTITDTGWGGELLDIRNTTYEYSHNRVSTAIGVDVYNDCLGAESNCGMIDSEIFIRNNDFNSGQGVLLEGTFLNGTKALVLGNDFTHVTDTAVYLGVDTSHCTVIGTTGGTVVDLGTNNTVIAMANRSVSHDHGEKPWWWHKARKQ